MGGKGNWSRAERAKSKHSSMKILGLVICIAFSGVSYFWIGLEDWNRIGWSDGRHLSCEGGRVPCEKDYSKVIVSMRNSISNNQEM